MRGFRDDKLAVTAFLLCFAMVSWAWAQDAPKKGSPPKKLSKQEDGHWSPYNAPESSEGASVHVIERGDTLWGLATKHLGDPNLWPQIWESNSYVKNPHWIYPGDRLMIKGQVVLSQERLQQERARQPEPAEAPDSSPALAEPVVTLQPRVFEVKRPGALAITGRDLYCSGFVTQQSPPISTFIVGAEEEYMRARLVENDIIYINKGRRQELIPGTEYAIVRPRGTVKGGPKKKHRLGHYISEIGKARVLVVHADSATAEVVFSCDNVLIGDLLVPFVDKRSPLSKTASEIDSEYALQRYTLGGRMATFEKQEMVETPSTPAPRTQGRIILAKEDLSMLGEGHIVYVDLGKQVGLSPGDVLVAYRDPRGFGVGGFREQVDVNPTYGPEMLGYREAYRKAIKERKVPHHVFAELVILHVNDITATAKIVYAREELQVGDKVALLR